MTPRTRNTALAVTGAAAVAFGAYALGSQSGDGSAVARSAGSSTSGTAGAAVFVHRGGRPGFGRGREENLQPLADSLGVSTTALRDALQSVRDELRPKQDPRDDMAE